MRILITTDWYEPVINGVVTSVLTLKRELVKRGHEVRVATLSDCGHSYKKDDVYYMRSVDISRIYPGARAVCFPGSSLYEELIEWQPDLVHSQCEFSSFLIARKIAGELGIPVVHTYHTVYEDIPTISAPEGPGAGRRRPGSHVLSWRKPILSLPPPQK